MKLIHSFLILTLLLAQMANANYFRATREINELAVEEKNVVAEEDAMWTRMVQEVNSFQETSAPTGFPTAEPTGSPTTSTPTQGPTISMKPSASGLPTGSQIPTNLPTVPTVVLGSEAPTGFPTPNPSPSPTELTPTLVTNSPSKVPTNNPTQDTTQNPTQNPTDVPTTSTPTGTPSKRPSPAPQIFPTTLDPTKAPTRAPTKSPTKAPTRVPTKSPTKAPTNSPTKNPTPVPTLFPTRNPTPQPSPDPTPQPSPQPSPDPTPVPTISPTAVPTAVPTVSPTDLPTATPTASPPPTIQVKLTPYVLDVSAFDDKNSYQYEALQKTEEQIGVGSMSDQKLVQYFSLYCIYFATYGKENSITQSDPFLDNIVFPTWRRSENWDKNNVDPCNGWRGISCSNDQVIDINLSGNRLTGNFPSEVTLLSGDSPVGAGKLRGLEINGNIFLCNHLSCQNQNLDWISNLGSNLGRLFFQNTNIAGALPKMPINLFEFDCSYTLVNGGLTDANFAGLNNLYYVVISGLSLGSSIPSVFGSLSNIELFYCDDSLITGDLSYMEGMGKLREHWVDNNPNLGGPLYPFISDIESMISLSLTDNALTGTIPTSFGTMSNLKSLWLFGNQLIGNVPTEIGDLYKLEFFQVEGNELTGSMPAEVCANTLFPFQTLTTLGADCAEITCSCCTCCTYDVCPNKG